MKKLLRIPQRIVTDVNIIRLASNWPDILKAKLDRSPITKIELRNGMTMTSPPEGRLNFLFHEIWLDKIYGETTGTVIDIGANIGIFALYAAAQGATVYAYEPFPKSADQFRQNTKNIPNIHLEQKAVAGQEGTGFLNTDQDWIYHSLGDSGIPVETVTLDSVLEKTGYCDVLKIDCEGSEYEILENCSNLNKIGRIVGEYHNKPNRGGAWLKNFLSTKGFSFSDIPMAAGEGMFFADNT